MGLVLGVDIGGTFTDVVLVDEAANRVWVGKELTTPRDPAAAVLTGLARLGEASGRAPSEIARVIHATTLITNALIERKGASTGLVTTRGFRDVLEIGREAKYDIYDMFLPLPPPLVPRERRHEVAERLDVDGTVVAPLAMRDVVAAGKGLVAGGVEAVAICFLYSYVNAEHERAAADLLRRRWPALTVTCSSDVAPEIREYERTSTTVANAYVKPLASRYLARLSDGLVAAGAGGPLHLMLSSGGIGSVDAARETPIQLLESGPAAGALIGAFFGRLSGAPHLLALDMGGTTAKLCLVDDGQPAITYSFEAARERRFKRGSGLPIRIASIELLEVGAGGGSIARVDELGLMKVGPDSAGAEPGPACYGRGGVEPTVTDAALVLGYLDPAFFLGGAMPLDADAARRAIQRVAAPLGVDPVRAAWGIHDIVCEQMAAAARIHVAEKGRDPRRYALLATGGAAPGHACRVAAKLGVARVICPPGAGVASTFGLLVAPPKVDLVASYVTRIDELDAPRLQKLYDALAADAIARLSGVGVPADRIVFERRADMRYVGQGFEIVVPLPPNADEGSLRAAFEAAYVDAYARLIPGAPIEALSWRLTALGPAPRAAFLSSPATRGGVAPKAHRPAWFPEFDAFRDVPVHDRYALAPGETLDGPAIVEERESTVVVPPAGRCRVDAHGSLVIDLEGVGG
jgi:N-methylhydantoinase A